MKRRAAPVHAWALHTFALCAAVGSLAVVCPPDASAAVPPPGPNAAPPANCPPPSDAACADATGPYAPANNAACAAAWKDHCAAVNQAQFDPARVNERRPSPTKTVFSSDHANNSIHIENYGVSSEWLRSAPPAAKGAAVHGNLRSGVQVSNIGVPPSHFAHKANGAKSISAKPATPIVSPALLAQSKQNTWIARENLARADAAHVCAGAIDAASRVGMGKPQDLVTCAEAYRRPLKANPPAIGTCEDFVYNRFYDIERWMDRTNACGHDPMCRATITLDPTDGIAGKWLSGSDVSAAHANDLWHFLDAFYFAGNNPPDCTNPHLPADQLQKCELLKSFPPIAHVVPNYLGPIGGAGTPQVCIKSDGIKTPCGFFATSAAGYWASKNLYYDAGPVFTPTLVNAFSGDAGKLQSVQRLVAALGKGSSYYYVGQKFHGNFPAGGQTLNYSDEWAFQNAMLAATRGTSLSTFRDYAKHKDFLKQRENTFGMLLASAKSATIKFAVPASAVDAQLQAGLPGGFFGRAGGSPPGSRVVATPDKLLPDMTAAFPNRALSAAASPRPALAFTQSPPSDIDRFAWNNGANPPQMDTSYPYPRLKCPVPDHFEKGYSAKSLAVNGMPGGSMPMTPINGPAINGAPSKNNYSDVATAACNYINAVLDEWARNDKPQALAPTDTNPAPQATGCFANDPACDWDPADFMAGIDDMVHYQIQAVQAAQREADYKFCKTWQPVIANEAKFSDWRQGELQAVTDMKTEVQGDYDKIADVPVIDRGGATTPAPWQKLKQPNAGGDSFSTFGEDRHNAETWGNDLFGVGYSYDIGWEMPTQWEKIDNPPGSYALCDFGLGAHAGFEAFAFAFGSDKFDIIDAALAAGANDYTNPRFPGDTQDPNNTKFDQNVKQAAFDADFAIAGDNLVAEDLSTTLNQTQTVPLASGANSWTLFTIPFQISFVTLEVSVGVGYKYGIDLNITPTHVQTCHQQKGTTVGTWKKPGPPSIGLTTQINPQGELDGIVDAYASLAGLAGIGVEVNLTLLGMGLPVTNTIMLQPPNLVIDNSLVMDMHTLDGSLSVYAELLFFRLFDITILSWSGIHHEIPLFNTTSKVDIPALDKLGATGLNNPGGSLKDL